MAYTAIDNPELYFQIKLYTGDGGTPSITLDGDEDMQPDFVWIKNRDATDVNSLFDTVRGVTNYHSSGQNTSQVTDADTLTSFDSNGFALGADVKVNTNTEKYVAWCWKESATAGFDMVGYTGNGSTRTIAHSLSAAPNVIHTHNYTNARNWLSGHTSLGFEENVYQDADNASYADSNVWNDTAPTSSVFTVGTTVGNNENTHSIIAYLWTAKQGFSKFGAYEGNGNADGTFVYTGFRPAWVMTKSIDSTSPWQVFDSKREGYNVDNDALLADDTAAEVTTDYIDLLSNGFKLRIATDPNVAETYIYYAFAEAPFVNSKGVPCNAR